MGRSGQLSRQWKRGGGITRGRKVNRDPLRKVLHRGMDEEGHLRDFLSCGHAIHQREDFIGPTYPEKRRCWRCRRSGSGGEGGE